jgi:sulfur carrier protein ThiS
VKVTIKLFATFREGRFDVAQRECPPGTTLAGLVRELGITPEEVGVVLVGGRHAAFEHVAAAGETIAIFPLLGGG